MKIASARIGALLGGLVLVAGLAGCGSSESDDSSADNTTPTHSTSTDNSGDAGGPPTVATVKYHREGGLKPVTVDLTFSRDQAPPTGYTATDVTSIVNAAQRFVDSGDKLAPTPANTCCDRYTYNVSIVYSDGTVKAFTTLDGVRWPPSFHALINDLASP